MLNKQWQQLAIATNWPVLAAVVFLSAVGIVTIHADRAGADAGDAPKQLVFMAVGVACMAAFQAANYQRLGRIAWPLYILSLGLVLYTAVGRHVSLPFVPAPNGACHWIVITRGLSLQPSELLKVGFVMVLARYLRYRTDYRRIAGLAMPFALAFVPVLLIFLQPDLGTALTFIPTLFVMLFVAGARLTHLAAIVLAAVLLVPFLWLSGTDRPVFRHFPALIHEYQRGRITAMLDSDDELSRKGSGFQQYRALIAFGSGGVAGKGPGHVPVGASVPEADNDMVFALVGEQFGFIGAAVVLVAYLVLFAAGVEISAATREPFGRLVAVGVVSMLAGQTFLNLGVTMKLLPVTGVTLPFISAGGSSLIASFIAAGLLLNIGQNRPLVMANDAFEFG